MVVETLRTIARQIVEELAQGDYDLLVQRFDKSRLSSEQLRAVIGDYGRKPVAPPRDSYKALDAVEVNSTTVPTWSVRVPIWTAEEGPSDLTLELTISLGPGKPRVELDDLHVL